jgi:hypothetical protein
MKYYGTITGLTPAATPGALPPAAEERPGPDYLGLGLLCLAGVVICAGIAYMVGRMRRR